MSKGIILSDKHKKMLQKAGVTYTLQGAEKAQAQIREAFTESVAIEIAKSSFIQELLARVEALETKIKELEPDFLADVTPNNSKEEGCESCQ